MCGHYLQSVGTRHINFKLKKVSGVYQTLILSNWLQFTNLKLWNRFVDFEVDFFNWHANCHTPPYKTYFCISVSSGVILIYWQPVPSPIWAQSKTNTCRFFLSTFLFFFLIVRMSVHRQINLENNKTIKKIDIIFIIIVSENI